MVESNFLILKIEAPLNKQVDECIIRIGAWDFLSGSNSFVYKKPFLGPVSVLEDTRELLLLGLMELVIACLLQIVVS